MDIFNYYQTGALNIIEKVMIFFLVAFLIWNVKLFLEKPKATKAEEALDLAELSPAEGEAKDESCK